jgi:phenylpyruvate tautomerase PptA (4-oxalocrotonate tautomerase family)/ketosteroid isomerase-like protein
MPFVSISVSDSTPAATRRAIADGIHRALVDAIGIPVGDRFQIVTSQPAKDRFFDPEYLGISRQDVIAIEITLVRGRPLERKRALYRRITDELVAVGVRSQDVFITLTENGPADWSVGEGRTQLADAAGQTPFGQLTTTFGREARNRLDASADPEPAGAQAALETFYHAFNTANAELIGEVWLDDPLVQLSNPLGGSLRGRAAVTGLYAKIFAGTVRPWVCLEDVTQMTAVPGVTIFTGRERGEYGDVELDMRTTRCFAYRESAGGWRLIHHHGSIDDPRQLSRYQDAVASRQAGSGV